MTYLSGTSTIAQTGWVLGGRCHCCLICVHCMTRRYVYVGHIQKALEEGYSEHPSVQAVLTLSLRISWLLDDARVARCLVLSTGGYRVFVQIHSPRCCTRYTTKILGSETGSLLWGGVHLPYQCKKASYSRFAATCMHPQEAPNLDHRRGRFFCKSILGLQSTPHKGFPTRICGHMH